MPQDAAFYRIGLIETIILLLLLLLTFGAITVILRERWLALGSTDDNGWQRMQRFDTLLP